MSSPVQTLISEFQVKVPEKYILYIRNDGGGEDSFIWAVHITWVRQLVAENKFPTNFPTHDTLTDDQIYAFLSQGLLEPLGPYWIFLHATTHAISSSVLKDYVDLDKQHQEQQYTGNTEAVPSPSTLLGHGSSQKTWTQVIDFLGEASFNYTWEEPYLTYLDIPREEKPLDLLTQIPQLNYFKILINKLFPDYNSSSDCSSTGGHIQLSVSNLAQPIGIIYSQNSVLTLYIHSQHSLQECLNFSPQKILSSNVKSLFVLYQILQLLRDLELLAIPTSNLTLHDFWTDESLYVIGKVNLCEILVRLERKKSEAIQRSQEINQFVTYFINVVKTGTTTRESPEIPITPQLLESVIRHWCEGLVTNYEYLMFLNYLAGRRCNVNPNYHPVFPWINDFSSKNSGWRDLSKSKFRLNKGERQLDLMFEERTPGTTNIPHHVTDILSEITYYVYKARRTPKEVLCKFVRPKWVPAEYPNSIQRMQEWTPDECIPEFYDDSSIFESIHQDLPNLSIPPWCSTPKDFIAYHRTLLESDVVSAKLHHWIDLTFGYKLSGNPAIKSKNIYLSLVDSHQNLAKTGMVQLFQTPHPPRKCSKRNAKNIVRYSDLKKLREAESSQEKDYITLPKNYDPCGFLNDYEVSVKFFKVHFDHSDGILLQGLKNTNINRTNPKPNPYVKLFGCLLVELLLGSKIHYVSGALRDINVRFELYKSLLHKHLEPIPTFIKRAIHLIFGPKEYLNFSIPLDPSIELLLLDHGLCPLPFPKYFPTVYKILCGLRNYDSSLQTSDPNNLEFKSKVEELKVKSFSRELINVLHELDEEGLDLILPVVSELFRDPSTRVLAVWNLFCPISRAIGRDKTIETLLQPIIQIYESDYNSDKHLKLFHRSFLLQLLSCFGLRVFLDNFTTLLIEAIGGWKTQDPSSMTASGNITTSTPKHLKSMDEIEESNLNSTKSQFQILTREDSIIATDAACLEPEIFFMDHEHETSDSEDSTSANNLSNVTLNSDPNLSAYQNPDLSGASGASSSSNADARSVKSQSQSTTENDITDMCCESVMWLVHRIGPVLCAKFISKNLLRMLTLCYFGHFDCENPENIIYEFRVNGDLHSLKVLECLIRISDLYGPSFIERQYIPYATGVVESASKKMTQTLEAALVGISALLEQIFCCIEDALLVSLLNDSIISPLLKPIIELISSDIPFPSGPLPRPILVNKLINILILIRRKIGPDLSQKSLKDLVIQLCEGIKVMETNSDSDPFITKLAATFSSRIYTSFYHLLVGSEHETKLRDQIGIPNSTVMSSYSKQKDLTALFVDEKRNLKDQETGFASRSFGNRIFVPENEGNSVGIDLILSPISNSPPKDKTRHLKGNWLLYWDHERTMGPSSTKFNFKQIKLQCFTGHSGSVRSICSLDNENSFLTGSKDKTCKVFSLRNQGDETMSSTYKWAYTSHKKPVLSVLFNEPLHLAASTDGIIHIWDPFIGKSLRILETSLGKNIRCLKPIPSKSTFVGAGAENFIVCVDPRTSGAFELKMGIGQNSGIVRCMSIALAGDIVSVGHSSGMISSLDLRVGTLLGSFRAHEGEVLQLATHQRHLISSSLDQNISIWNLEDNKLAFNLRGSTEPAHSLTAYDSQLISCTTSNRLQIHDKIDVNSNFSSTRIRSDSIKGLITTMNLLPLNNLLLVGSDSGLISLLC